MSGVGGGAGSWISSGGGGGGGGLTVGTTSISGGYLGGILYENPTTGTLQSDGNISTDGSGNLYLNGNGLLNANTALINGDIQINGNILDFSRQGVISTGDRTLIQPSSGLIALDWSGSTYTGASFDNNSAGFNGGGGLTVASFAANGFTTLDGGNIYTNGSGSFSTNSYIYAANGVQANGASSFDGAGIVTTGSGKFSRYNNVTLVGNSIITTPGNYSNIGLTASIASTTIYTHPTGSYGQYRITTNLVCHAAGTAGTVSVQGQFTDSSNTAQTLNLVTATNILLTTKGNNSFGINAITAYPSTAIKFTTTVTGLTGAASYDLFIILEKLQ